MSSRVLCCENQLDSSVRMLAEAEKHFADAYGLLVQRLLAVGAVARESRKHVPADVFDSSALAVSLQGFAALLNSLPAHCERHLTVIQDSPAIKRRQPSAAITGSKSKEDSGAAVISEEALLARKMTVSNFGSPKPQGEDADIPPWIEADGVTIRPEWQDGKRKFCLFGRTLCTLCLVQLHEICCCFFRFFLTR